MVGDGDSDSGASPNTAMQTDTRVEGGGRNSLLRRYKLSAVVVVLLTGEDEKGTHALMAYGGFG